MITAENLYEKTFKGLNIEDNEHLIPKLMIEFAKLHCVEQALIISESRSLNMLGQTWYCYTLSSGTKILNDVKITIDKDSIQSAYSLDNIK